MNLSDLQRKDIVSIVTGKRLGRIIDAKMNDNGMIEYFIILDRKFWRFWRSAEENNLTISQIKKIGYDVILVDI